MGGAGVKKRPATPHGRLRSNGASPSIVSLFKRAAHASYDQKPKVKELYEIVRHLCLNANETPEDRRQILQTVETAIAFIGEPGRMSKLENALGYRPPLHHHIATAMTVAAFDLDRISGDTKADGAKKGEKSRGKKKKAAGQKHENPSSKIATVIASLLQEFVAYDAMTIEEVGEKFGYDTDIYKLTREASRITRMPISMRQPDKEGRLSVADIRFNRAQAALAQDLVLLTENPVRVGMIKTAQVLQQMRDLDLNEPLGGSNDISDVLSRTALHIREMYLPLMREIGMRDILNEMKKLILKALDSQGAKNIEIKREPIASNEQIKAVSKWVEEKAVTLGYDKRAFRIIGGGKETYSIWAKILKIDFDDVAEKGDECALAAYAKANEVNLHSIYDVLRFRIIFKDCLDINGQVDARANEELLKKVHKNFLKIFIPVADREKDRLGVNKKPNGYEALQDTFDIGGFAMEMHFVTESMEAINEGNHSSYKQEECMTNGSHPAFFFPRSGRDRGFWMSDILARLFARLIKDPLPDHASREDIVISDIEGNLVSRLKGATLRDLITNAFSMDWAICDKAGDLLPRRPGANDDEYLQDTLHFIEEQEPGMLDRPLVHADTVPYVCFEPIMLNATIALNSGCAYPSAKTFPGNDARL
ncbi:MAG: hypothetical protein PHY92_08445 [Alphaproteobacteria bacterium]|nr:hypothetical protein [Alphaproteobacteria bacterium]